MHPASHHPVVRLEVEGIRHTVVRVLQDQAIDVQASVEKAVEEFLATYDIEAEVKRTALTAINESVKKAIDWAVRRAFDTVEHPIKQAAYQRIREALTEIIPPEAHHDGR